MRKPNCGKFFAQLLSQFFKFYNFTDKLKLKLLPGYRGLIVDRLQNLFSLDDKPITKEERLNYQDFDQYADKLNDYSEIRLKFNSIKNLTFPETPEVSNFYQKLFFPNNKKKFSFKKIV